MTFTIANNPDPDSSLKLFLGNIAQIQDVDYTISGVTITYTTAPPIELASAPHKAFYRTGTASIIPFGQAWEINSDGFLAPTSSRITLLDGGFISNSTSTVTGGLTIDRSTTTSATTTNLFASLASTTTLYLGTGACDTLDTDSTGKVICGTDDGGAAGGADFPDVQTWGNATSTTLGFLQGFLSTASSTINASSTVTGVLTASGGIYGNLVGNVTGNADTATDAATSTLLANNNTWGGDNIFSSLITGSISGNAGTVTNGVYTGRTLTINGDAQDLSADRSWTVSSTTLLANNNTWSGGNVFGNATTTNLFSTTASSTNLFVGNSVAILDSGTQTTLNGLCIALTGSADLCDGNDASGGASAYDAWTHPVAGDSATTSNLIFGTASSTVVGSLNITGNSTTTAATTTNLFSTTASSTSLFTGTISATALTAPGSHNLSITSNGAAGIYLNSGAVQMQISGKSFLDGGEEMLKLSDTTTAVNELTVTNASTNNPPTLTATGNDTDISLSLSGKGSGTVLLPTGFLSQASSTIVGAFTNTGAFINEAGSLEIPNGTAPVVDAVGEMAFDTTDNQLLIATSTNASYPAVYPAVQKLWGATVASTSPDFISGGRIFMPPQRDGFTIKEIHCIVDGGTSVVINVSNTGGTTDSETVTCDADGQTDIDITTNNTYTAGSFNSLEVGTITGTVDYVTFSVWGVFTRE